MSSERIRPESDESCSEKVSSEHRTCSHSPVHQVSKPNSHDILAGRHRRKVSNVLNWLTLNFNWSVLLEEEGKEYLFSVK